MSQLDGGDVVDERFEVEFCAGVGGMGRVYRCLDLTTGKNVALKVMAVVGDASIGRFAREVRLLSELRHPGIVRYLTHGALDDGSPYLVMEWVDGSPLGGRIASERLSVREGVRLARRLCEAVGEAHARQIVHRDLKPANILLQDGDLAVPKVVDFGLARSVDATQAITQTGTMVGTPAYMAPEQARRTSLLDTRADVFALGCVLFECLAGFPAFRGPNVVSVLCKVLLEDPPWLCDVRRDVPAEVADLIMRMLSKDPDTRPRDANAVLEALDAAAVGTVPPPSQRAAIGAGEQRFLSVILAGRPLHPTASADEAVTAHSSPRYHVTLRKALSAFELELEQMVDGTAVITLRGKGLATDRVARAARCALAVRDLMPHVPVVLATGRGTVEERQPAGEVIDVAARMLHAAADLAPSLDDGGTVLLDSVTESLLDARFDLRSRDGQTQLLGYRSRSVEPRKLLGRETPCVGRTRELTMLRAVWDECVEEGVARPVVVTGPGGIGKTRLVREWLGEIERESPDTQIFRVRADVMGTAGAFGLLGKLLRSVVGCGDGVGPERLRQKIQQRVASRLDGEARERVSDFLADMVDAMGAEEESIFLRAAHLDPVLRGDQIRRAITDWICAEVRAHPTILLLEDLQWGDQPTVEILDGLMKAHPEQPLCIVAVARPEVEDKFPRLWAERDVTAFSLGPLRRRAAIQLVCAALDDVGEDRAAAMADRSGGNPFFLEELIRAASSGHWAAAPETVLAILQARLEDFSPTLRRVLRAGSIYGERFSIAAVSALLDEHIGDVPEHCRVLVERELLVSERAEEGGGTEFSFAQALWRDASYALLTEDDRRVGHALAGRWLEANQPASAAAIAEHYEIGHKLEKASQFYLEAARQALSAGDYQAALTRADKGLECGADERLGELRCIQAEAHKWRGENPQASERALSAMERLNPGTRYWYGAAGEAAAASGKLNRGDVLVALAAALAAAQDSPANVDVAAARTVAHARTATQLVLAGRTDVADDLLSPLLEAEPDPAVAGWVREAQAVRAGSNNDPVGRVLFAEQAAECFAAADDRRNACLQHTSVGFALNEIGSHGRARQSLLRAIELGGSMDLSNAVSTARAQLGRCLARLGEFAEAEQVLMHAARDLAKQNNQRLEGVAQSYLAWLYLEMEREDDAELAARRALVVLQGVAPLEVSCRATLARVLLRRGEIEAADEVMASAGPVLERLGTVPTGEGLVRLSLVECALAAGRTPDALAALDGAQRWLSERAGQIADATLREAFEAMPENRSLAGLIRDHAAL